jgi:hypothetical protein
MARYADYVSRIMEPLGPTDGVPESEIRAAEERLGVRLPELLREFYLRVGNRPDICLVYNRLLPPNRLERIGNIVAFYVENQGCTIWGVDLASAQKNPPVPEASSFSGLENPRFVMERLSDFLLFELFWQAGRGGAPCSGSLDSVDFEPPKEAPAGWELLALPEWDYRVFVGKSQALFVYSAFAWGSARDAESFRVLVDMFMPDEEAWDISGCADVYSNLLDG